MKQSKKKRLLFKKKLFKNIVWKTRTTDVLDSLEVKSNLHDAVTYFTNGKYEIAISFICK